MQDVKVIIVDEVSIMGIQFFYQREQRLRQAPGKQEPSGNHCVVLIGGYNQLPTVGGNYIYITSEYQCAYLLFNSINEICILTESRRRLGIDDDEIIFNRVIQYCIDMYLYVNDWNILKT